MPPPVDASTPVPDELDARVEQMLQQMDRVHDDVVNKLGPAVDEKPASGSNLEGEVERALRDAAEAAQVVNKAAEAPPVPQEPVVSPVADPVSVSAPVPPPVDPVPPPAPVAEEPAVEEVESVPTETIQELDTQLANAVPATPVDDEFADGASLVEGQSLDVPLPPSSPLGDLPEVVTPQIETPPPAPAPVAPAPQPAPAPPAPAPVPQPVAKPAPVQPPAPKPAPAPVSKPVTPAVIPAPVKPKGPTFADQFWRIATPVVEPIAVRLGKLPVGFQHTVGWIGIVTLFMACATWAYVLFFQETRPLSHILEEQQREQAAAHSGEKGHGEGEGAKNEHGGGGGEGEHGAPANEHGEKPGAEKSGEAKHTESGGETHDGGETKGHAPEKPAAEKPAKESEKHGSNEGHEDGGHGGH